MLGVDVEALTLAGAFVTGVVLATFAVLRVVRHLAVMFGGDRYRRRLRPPRDEPDDPTNL